MPAWLYTGILCGLAWPSFSVETGWLAWVGLVPMLLRVRSVRSFREYAAVTFPAFLVMLPFMCWWLSYFSLWAMPMIWLTQSPGVWLPMALQYPLQRRFGWRTALLFLPVSWTVWEWAWLALTDLNLAAGNILYTQSRLLFLNQFVDHTGQWGLLFWLVALNVIIARTLDVSTTWSVGKLAGRLALVTAGWLAGPVIYSAVVLWLPTLVTDKNPATIKVGLVQTNEDSYGLRNDSTQAKILTRLIALGTKAVARKPDIVVAPEGAFPLPLMQDSALFAGMRQYVQYYDTPFATGLMTPVDSTHYYNEAFVFTPELSRIYKPLKLTPADVQVYRKQKSLAFGEVTPGLLGWANRWIRPGKASVTLGQSPFAFTFTDRKQNTRKLAIAICWEQLYPGTIAGLTRQGSGPRSAERSPADFLAFIMNDGWFYDSPGPRILLAFTQLRAIENRRGIARCSNQGYSGYVDPFGRVVSTLPRRQEAVGQISVMTNTQLTFFTKHPDWFPMLCVLLLSIGLLWQRQTLKIKSRTKAHKRLYNPVKTNSL